MQGNDVVQSNNWFGAFKTETTEGADAFAGAAPGAGEVQRFRKLDIKQNITMQRDDAGTATDTGEPGVPIPIDCDVEWEMPL